MRRILGIHRGGSTHWVGTGFPVRTLFSHERLGAALSPFLMLDHAGPVEFAPSGVVRGVSEHAHRGFVTVTLVFDGEIEHRDSTGGGGRIGPGDVQWMTSARGIMHEEFHSAEFSRRGGTLHVVQLWVNLPARAKMLRPGYQTLRASDIPSFALSETSGHLRIIAGEYAGQSSPVRSCTPTQVWDVRLSEGARWSIPVNAAYSVCLAILSGTAVVNHVERVGADNIVVFDRDRGEVIVDADADTHLLVLSGEPLNEPIVAHGPFVMNTTEEIQQAITDLHRGEFGQIESPVIRSTSEIF